MIYVALLRGINVGGNNKIDMKQLKVVFEKADTQQVSTFLNTGNVIFSSTANPKALTTLLQKSILKEFDLEIKVLLRSIRQVNDTVTSLPDSWQNNTDMKCDVMFLWDGVDDKSVLDKLTIKPSIDEVKYVPGAILWRVDREHVTKSGLLKIIGTDLYKQLTIRNCNTTRKLLLRMQQLES